MIITGIILFCTWYFRKVKENEKMSTAHEHEQEHETALGNVTTIGKKLGETYVKELQKAMQTEFEDHARSLTFKDWYIKDVTIMNEYIRYKICYTNDLADQEFRNQIMERWKKQAIKLSIQSQEDWFLVPFANLIPKAESVNNMRGWTIFDAFTFFGLFLVMCIILYIIYIIDPDRYPLVDNFISWIYNFGADKPTADEYIDIYSNQSK